MSTSFFEHVRIAGVKTALPENFIDIDDELEYFGGSVKKLARAKKMVGYGRRYIADKNTTVTDLAVDAAQKLMDEMKIDPSEIDLLLFVNQKPDYAEPCDACLAHGLLGLKTSCAAMSISLGCSGYVHGLWTAHAMISCGAAKNVLLLAGDIPGRDTPPSARKAAPVFGDAASATLLTYTPESRKATFVMGADGTGWDKIISPFGGRRLPLTSENVDLFLNGSGGKSIPGGLMKGEDVFKFTMDVAPALINETMAAAALTDENVDLYIIHQANKQIVENIITLAGISTEKCPVDVFSKYANTSTNSVVTVLCDQSAEHDLKNVIFCAFGIGLSWGAAAVDISDLYNGGFTTYVPPADKKTREQQIEYWINYIKGE